MSHLQTQGACSKMEHILRGGFCFRFSALSLPFYFYSSGKLPGLSLGLVTNTLKTAPVATLLGASIASHLKGAAPYPARAVTLTRTVGA